MIFTYWVYPARPVERDERTVELPPKPSYRQLCQLLDPLFQRRHFEHVTVLYEGRRADMFVDERGRLDDLPFNEAATAIYRNNWLTQYPGTNPDSLHWIAGLAVLFEKIVWT